MEANGKISVLSIFGTRPEATKMVPLIKQLADCPHIDSRVCITAQHREMLDSVLNAFGIIPDFDLNIMQKNQNLEDITIRALSGCGEIIRKSGADLVLVHGDTTTAMAASLAAFYGGIKLGHVEAGLRTHNKAAPYPEEMNRRITGALADMHFAPTATARDNLLRENIPADNIFVTGNTAIDFVKQVANPNYRFICDDLNHIDFDKHRIITITAHRRENYGEPLENICRAVARIAADFPDCLIVWPVHLSPVVRGVVMPAMAGLERVLLLDPIDARDLQNLLAKSTLVLTDSGGIQEEAPAYNKPVVVLRDTTERPEGLATGCLTLAGTNENTIYTQTATLLTNTAEYQKMANAKNPFGDGQASHRIHTAILYKFNKAPAPMPDFK
ncbi:MAG: UDP-N-acetylglucosamine 2-epimerase (non-hydrolyzing) [Defluviitaleaceae bacterium]|nr:UDP-N-acetylglucosamine 2-epimerase (non-hydrolyzing) [Defluviitaleaceae bacterium]